MTYKFEIFSDFPATILELFENSNFLIQQTPFWAKVIEKSENDEPFFLIAKDETNSICGLITCFLHKNEFGNLLISVPSYGSYGGIVVKNGENSKEIHKLLLENLVEFGKSKNCVLVTISTPPFFEQKPFYDIYFKPDFIRENFYHFFDLKENFLDLLNSKQRNNFKRNLKIAQESGLQIEFSENTQDFDFWHEIHKKRMNEISANAIPKSFFQSIFEYHEFGKNVWFAIIKFENKIIAGAIFVGNTEVVDIFMQSSDSDYFELNANTFLIFSAIQYFSSKNVRYLNWQSSNSQKSGSFNFKKNWAAKMDYHRYLTKIIGDISQIKKLSVKEIKENFGIRYVLPFSELESEK